MPVIKLHSANFFSYNSAQINEIRAKRTKMEVLGQFLYAAGVILDQLLYIYMWVVIVAALVTWVNADPFNPIVKVLFRLTEPLYAFIHRFIRTYFQGFDFAPLIVILAIQFLRLFVVELMIKWSH